VNLGRFIQKNYVSLGIALRVFVAFLSALTILSFLKYSLYAQSQRYIEEFKVQNSIDLTRGDVFPIARKLGAVAKSDQFVCIKAKKGESVFFEDRKGSCNKGIFQTTNFLTEDLHEIRIDFSLRLQRELVLGYSIFLLIQFLLAISILWNERRFFLFSKKKDLELAGIARQIGHDIRSPLAILKMEAFEKSSIQSNALNRLEELSSHLLAGKKKSIHLIHLEVLVKESIKEKMAEFRDSIQIELTLQATKKWILPGDAFQWRRILSNLINNAYEAKTLEVAKVTIELEEKEDHLLLKIRDQGRGISSNNLQKIGELGFTSEKVGGSGLGIHSAKTFLSSVSGDLYFESKEGRGCEVFLRIPKIDKVVFIDDDNELGELWMAMAKKKDFSFQFLPFNGKKEQFPLSARTLVFLDFMLDADANSIHQVAKNLKTSGVEHIFLSTGLSEQDIALPPWAMGVTGKEPPF
jgi:signal transduction histidine kinase